VEAKLRALISEECGDTDHGVHTLVRTGTPFQEILAATKQLRADMIILAVSESGPISIGHTAERVLRYASCPVLLVRPGDGAAAASRAKAHR
jgi:nucleotide-binding universal stress UspA family protein